MNTSLSLKVLIAFILGVTFLTYSSNGEPLSAGEVLGQNFSWLDTPVVELFSKE